MTQNKDYYSVQGHSRLPMSVPIEIPQCNFLLVINNDILSRTVSKLSQIIVQILDEKRPLCVFEPLLPLGCL